MFKDNDNAKKLLFNSILKIIEELIDDEEVNEETLQFFPGFFTSHLHQITKDYFKQIFYIIIEKSSVRDNDVFMNKCLNLGIEIIKTYGKEYTEAIINTIDPYLNSTKL